MNTSHPDPPTSIAVRGAQNSNGSLKSPASRMVGFTNNLLATSVVIVVALAVGNQLIALWGRPSQNTNNSATLVSGWPEFENCAIEFGNRPYTMTRRCIRGDREHAVRSLTKSCQQILQTSPAPSDTMGDAEARMIDGAENLTPMACENGKWRLFQVKNPQNDNLPMVIGLRDDCEQSRYHEASRMVTWGIATPTGESSWTLFVCRSSDNHNPIHKNPKNHAELVPHGSRKSLGISGEHGSQLVGFTGGEPTAIKQFYQQLAQKKMWKFNWEQTTSGWQCKLTPDPNESFGVQIQLTLDANQLLRGLVIVQPKTIQGKTE